MKKYLIALKWGLVILLWIVSLLFGWRVHLWLGYMCGDLCIPVLVGLVSFSVLVYGYRDDRICSFLLLRFAICKNERKQQGEEGILKELPVTFVRKGCGR